MTTEIPKFRLPPINLEKVEQEYSHAKRRLDSEIRRIGLKHPAVMDLFLCSPQFLKAYLTVYPAREDLVRQRRTQNQQHQQVVGHLQDVASISELWYISELAEASDDSYDLPDPDPSYTRGYNRLIGQVTGTDEDIDREILGRRKMLITEVNSFLATLLENGQRIDDVLEFINYEEPTLKARFLEFREGINTSRTTFILDTLMRLRSELVGRRGSA